MFGLDFLLIRQRRSRVSIVMAEEVVLLSNLEEVGGVAR